MEETIHTISSLSKSPLELQTTLDQLIQFRQQLYDSFPSRADAIMNLIDALSSNINAQSVAELSLNPIFPYTYNSIYDGIQNFFQPADVSTASEERYIQQQQLMQLISTYLPTPQKQDFWLFGIDVTPSPRCFAHTLADRTYVYQPNPVAGNKPVTIGHQYSALVLFPEKQEPNSYRWVVPLSVRRVESKETKRSTGVYQVKALMKDETLPFYQELCVAVGDSDYSSVSYLGEVATIPNLITVARVRSNRVFYRQPEKEEGKNKPGHPKWYGERFDLKDSKTWGKPDEVIFTTHTTRSEQTYTVRIEGWYELLMRGTREYPMHKYPFSLIRIQMFNSAGELVWERPMWLMIIGERRKEISLLEAWKSYLKRYDIEHFFRFGKQKLLTTAYQTPEVQYEENWWQLTQLAYVQLWLARNLAEKMPRPWERYLPRYTTELDREASPTEVQRDFGRIRKEIGTPAKTSKPRGFSPGRSKGESIEKRESHPVIKKTAPKEKKAA